MVEADRAVEHRQAVGRRDRREPAAAHAFLTRVAELAAHAAGPQAPGDGLRGQAVGAAARGEPVEEGVGGGVVALARVAEHTGGRGEVHEPAQRAVRGQLVQVPGGVGLGVQDTVEALGGQGVDRAVVEDAGRVDDAGQARDAGEQRGDGVAVGAVARGDGDGRAEPGQLLGQFGRARGVRATAAGQHEVADAVLGDQVAGQHRAETAGAAGDQDGAVRALRDGQHQLADVLGLAQQPERLGRAAHVPDAARQRLEGSGREQLQDLGPHAGKLLRSGLDEVVRPVVHPGVLRGDLVRDHADPPCPSRGTGRRAAAAAGRRPRSRRSTRRAPRRPRGLRWSPGTAARSRGSGSWRCGRRRGRLHAGRAACRGSRCCRPRRRGGGRSGSPPCRPRRRRRGPAPTRRAAPRPAPSARSRR